MKRIILRDIKKLLPRRSKSKNKTDYGNALIIGGHQKYLGAAILSALAATKMGAGYTHLMSDARRYPWLQFPDFILHSMNKNNLKNKQNYAVGVGPGLGVGINQLNILKFLVKNKFENVVVDADAITLLAKNNMNIPSTWILTPHEGELARLLKISSILVKKDRLKYAQLGQEKYGCHLLLKGSETILVDKNKDIFIVKEGMSCLAKAGSGDVLTGLITALLAQNLKPIEAMKVASFIHGRASKNYMKNGNDELSMRPIDLIGEIPQVIKKLR